MRETLRKWCENGLDRITEDIAELQMHKAIRNLTRLFERIQDFEKRVCKRRGQLDRADAEAQVAALLLLARALAPFAPHTAEEILLGSGRVDASDDLPGVLARDALRFRSTGEAPGDRFLTFTQRMSDLIRQAALIATRGSVMN